jgi:hypothetical protein
VGPGCQRLEREREREEVERAGGACWPGSKLGLYGKRIEGRGEGGPDEMIGPVRKEIGKEVYLSRGEKKEEEEKGRWDAVAKKKEKRKERVLGRGWNKRKEEGKRDREGEFEDGFRTWTFVFLTTHNKQNQCKAMSASNTW